MRSLIIKEQILQKMITKGAPVRACEIVASNQNVELINLERAALITRKWHDPKKTDYKIAFFRDDEQRQKAIEWLKARGVKVSINQKI